MPTGASAPRKSRAIQRFFVLTIALFLCLLAPAVARATSGDTSDTTTTTPGDAHSGPDTTTTSSAPTETSTAQTSTSQSVPADPAASVAPDSAPQSNGNGNGNGNANGNGNGNSSTTAAPVPAVAPDPAPPVTTTTTAANGNSGNNDNTPNGNANGQSQAPPATTAIPEDSPGNSDHAGNANANANSEQDKPKNVNVGVRVGNPGDNGAVVQGNDSTAAAGAGASGGSGSGSSGGNNEAVSTGTSADIGVAPNGNVPPAASQADSTSGETPPVANSPPCGQASNESAAGAAGSANEAAAAGQSPTVSGSTPSASCVSGAENGAQPGPDNAANDLSGDEVTGVTGVSEPDDVSDDDEATDVTGSGGDDTVVDVTLPPGADGDIVVGDPAPDTTDTDPALSVNITAPMPEGSTSSNTATAGATSTQVSPENVNASVRVLSPGDNGPVQQTNSSTATAAAGATGPAAGTSVTSTPTATSTQVTPVNVNVSVRVGSPGDDGGVTQANTSDATASNVDPATIEPAVAELPDQPNSYGDVLNGSGIVQDIAQCGNEEDLCVTGPGAETESADDGQTVSAPDLSSATATQQAPSNVSVSVRVASPGEDGLVTQLNDATASGATSVTTVTDPDNLVVGIDVPGDPNSVVIPTDPDTPWVWNWNWTTGTAPTDPSATPFDTPDWNWNWTVPEGAAPASAVTTSPDVPTPTPGQWTWTWIWTRGDGWTTTWTYTQACNCTWSWIWTWTWPADTPSTPQTASAPAELPPPPSNPQIVQTNESTAAAAALTIFGGQQTTGLISGGDPTDATRYQGITSIQQATASADAIQDSPLNFSLVTAGLLDSLNQRNSLTATSTAGTVDSSSQGIRQTQAGTDDGASHKVIGIQVIHTTQSATADAVASQSRVANINHIWSPAPFNRARIGAISQTNEAITASYTDNWSFVTQTIDQSQIGGGANQSALAVQVASTSQQSHASSIVSQSDLRNRTSIEIPWNGLWNPPITQSNVVTSGAIATNYSEITQSALQVASGEGIEWDQRSTQTATVKQGAAASAAAAQMGNENLALWNGTLASPPVAPGSGGSAGGGGADGGVEPQPVLIVGSPPLTPHGAVAGGLRSFGLSAFGPKVRKPFVLGGVIKSHRPGSSRLAPRHRGPKAASLYHHVFLNLLGAMSSALAVLLGATPFAALLALFTIAALVVGRLQYAVPALGRSADFARRERPG